MDLEVMKPTTPSAKPASAASARKLGFWETMLEISHDNFNGTAMVLQVARLRGPMTEGLLRAAAAALLQRHTILRTRIRTTDGASHLEAVDELGPVPIRVVPRAHDDHWQTVADEELSKAFTPAKGPLWRMVLIQDPAGDRSELVMVFHHAISDGLSIMHFTGELVAACARIAEGRAADAGPAAPLPPPLEALMKKTPSWIGYSLQQAFRAVFSAKPTPVPFDAYAPIAHRRTRNLYRAVSQTDVARLLERCREEKTTLSGALNAALIQAATAVRGARLPATINCNSAINLRNVCKVEPERFGCFATLVTTQHVLGEQTSFWDLSREYKRELDAQIPRQVLRPPTFSKAILTKGVGHAFRTAEERREYALGYALSNLGRLDLSDRHGPFQIDEIYFGTARHAGDFALALHVATLFGRMFCTFSLEEPLLQEPTAKAIADRFMSILQDAARPMSSSPNPLRVKAPGA